MNSACSERYADLHLHTTASDGADSPRRVVERAKALGFSAIAITDRDTTDGLAEATEAGKELGVEVVPGIELSTLDGKKAVHILGYRIDPSAPRLREILRRMIDSRRNCAVRMVEKLVALGVNISLERVREISGNEFLGRPHIAKAMLEAGCIRAASEAFTAEYIGNGGRAYIERFKLSPEEGIRELRAAGGVAVLAHPGYLNDRSTLDEEEILRFKASGLQGLEVYYNRHTPEQTEYYRDVAERLGLLLTGGSDCHGGAEATMGSVRLEWGAVERLWRSRLSSDQRV